jgi:hypothetical protein
MCYLAISLKEFGVAENSVKEEKKLEAIGNMEIDPYLNLFYIRLAQVNNY